MKKITLILGLMIAGWATPYTANASDLTDLQDMQKNMSIADWYCYAQTSALYDAKKHSDKSSDKGDKIMLDYVQELYDRCVKVDYVMHKASADRLDALPLIKLGMTEQEVLGTRYEYGFEKHTRTTQKGVTSHWNYKNGTVLYFENGILVAIED
jgi:hypothetical protein